MMWEICQIPLLCKFISQLLSLVYVYVYIRQVFCFAPNIELPVVMQVIVHSIVCLQGHKSRLVIQYSMAE